MEGSSSNPKKRVRADSSSPQRERTREARDTSRENVAQQARGDAYRSVEEVDIILSSQDPYETKIVSAEFIDAFLEKISREMDQNRTPRDRDPHDRIRRHRTRRIKETTLQTVDGMQMSVLTATDRVLHASQMTAISTVKYM